MLTNDIFRELHHITQYRYWHRITSYNVCYTKLLRTANLPRLTTQDNKNNFRANDIWQRDGSFLKLRNLDLYYNLPGKILKLTEARIYLRGSNLFSLDNIKYADPEMISANYPFMSTYSMGVNIKF